MEYVLVIMLWFNQTPAAMTQKFNNHNACKAAMHLIVDRCALDLSCQTRWAMCVKAGH